MESQIINTALTQSIWAALSMTLIFYILKKQEVRDAKQEEREVKYQEIIKELTDRLNVVNELEEHITEIKKIIISSK